MTVRNKRNTISAIMFCLCPAGICGFYLGLPAGKFLIIVRPIPIHAPLSDQPAMTIADRSTFIAGSPRSGTTLMTAMLDDHPELLVFPEEYLYVRPRALPGVNDRPLLQDMFKEKVLFRLQGKASFLDGMLEEGRDYADFDYPRFEALVDDCFRLLPGKDRGGGGRSVPALALVALVTAFARITGNGQRSRWVIKNPHYEVHWQQLFTDFPGARMIYMVRDPRNVILSRTIKKNKKRHLKQGGDPVSWKKEVTSLKPSLRFLQEWEHSIRAYHAIKQAFPGQILGVRYEDLVASPREVLREVTGFLGVDWDKSLLTPSFLGNPWRGGSIHGQSYTGINRSGNKGKRSFPPRYQWQLDAWLGDMVVKEPCRYALSGKLDRIDIKALLSGLRGEGIAEFMQNRLRMLSNRLNGPLPARLELGGAPDR